MLVSGMYSMGCSGYCTDSQYPMTKKTVPKQLIDSAEKAYQQWLEEAVESVRTHHIIPYCNKHKLCYVSGNGEWYISREDGSCHAAWYEDDTTTHLPKRLHNALCTDIYYGKQSLGSYVGDYTPPSLA
jgi:hypothetical protein